MCVHACICVTVCIHTYKCVYMCVYVHECMHAQLFVRVCVLREYHDVTLLLTLFLFSCL